MRIFNFLSAAVLSAFCLTVPSPALAQDSIPVFKLFDFEMNQEVSTLQGYGGVYTDSNEFSNDSIRGNSRLTTFKVHEDLDSSLWVPGRNEESWAAMQLGYQLGTVMLGCGTDCEYAPHVGLALQFSQAFDSLDLTGATHITFWAKGRDSLTVNVSVGLRDSVAAPASYSQTFVIDTTWTKYSIELKASEVFALPNWVTPYEFDVARANSIAFGITKADNPNHPENAFFLDDIEIVNWVYTPAVGIFKRDRNARVNGLRASLSGEIARIRLPAALLGKTGLIVALDATGRKVAQTGFGPQALDVSLTVPGASAKPTGLYFRAVTQ